MNNKSLISVIVPVYNVEPYVARCIESIINQSYKNLEIILVDDGSTDQSGKICDAYAAMDARIQVIHKKNGGLSSARNSGMRIAKGEYMGFVDSDDYIDVDMYESMVSHMDSDVDVVVCGRYICPCDQKRERISLCYTAPKCIKMNSEQAVLEWLRHQMISFGVYDKLYRKKVIGDLRFPDGRISEDITFVYNVLKKSRNVVHIGKAKYYNFQRPNSISRSPFFYRRIDYVIFLGEVCRDVRANYPDYIEYADILYIQGLLFELNSIREAEDRDKYINLEKRVKKALRHFIFRICRNEHISMADKKRYLLEMFS